MGFKHLDNELEELLKSILKYQKSLKNTLHDYVVENLVNNGYLKGHFATILLDDDPYYLITAINQKGKSYFELEQKYEEEQKRLKCREWRIAIISAIIGFIPAPIQYFI